MRGFGGGGTGVGAGVGDQDGWVGDRAGTGAGVTVLLGVVGAGVASVPAGRAPPGPAGAGL
jgi:hypothetical protein